MNQTQIYGGILFLLSEERKSQCVVKMLFSVQTKALSDPRAHRLSLAGGGPI